MSWTFEEKFKATFTLDLYGVYTLVISVALFNRRIGSEFAIFLPNKDQNENSLPENLKRATNFCVRRCSNIQSKSEGTHLKFRNRPKKNRSNKSFTPFFWFSLGLSWIGSCRTKIKSRQYCSNSLKVIQMWIFLKFISVCVCLNLTSFFFLLLHFIKIKSIRSKVA